jgi:protease-4
VPARVRLVVVSLVGAAVSWLALGGAPARAQSVSDPDVRPTRGPLITDAQRAGDADATAVELNPGALGLIPGAGFELVGAFAGDHLAFARRGAGLYFGAPIILNSSIGLGLTHVVGSGAEVGGTAPFVDAHTALRLAYALRLGRNFGLGVAWAHLWQGDLAGTNTFDFGLSWRLCRGFALGATVEDVGQPSSLPRLWTLEFVVRPLATDRLEIALGAAHANADLWRRIVPRARVSAKLAAGLKLYAEGSTIATGSGSTFGEGSDTRVGLGFALDFDHVGGAAAGYLYTPGGGGSSDGSIAARLHVDAWRTPSLVTGARVVRITLEGIDDDRAFVALVRRVRGVAGDPGVSAVLFKIEGPNLGLGRIEEVRELIALLRARGKRTFAYVTFPSTRDYYLAAAADAVILHPAGELALSGLAQSVTFYKTAMDRIGVHVDLVRIGAYKGAMEPYILTEQSPDVRANKNRLLDDVFARITTAIAADRSRTGHRMDAAEVRADVDRALYTPGEAQLAGLIDTVAAEGDLEPILARALGRASVTIHDPDPHPVMTGSWPGRRIAVVLVDGTIVDGPSRNLPFDFGDFAGSDTLVAALEACRADGSVAGVVLRVNSPGGSAFASDVVARAIVKLKEAGKPVVVSMGDLAASGGYYIAAPADVVFAEPSTVTGSIGVFGFKVDVAKLIGMLGVNVETYLRGAHADYLSPYRPWTEAETKVMLDKIHHLYSLFVDTVVTGRKSRGLTSERVDELGRGQVWSGARAQSLALVDKLGGLSEAIDEVTRLTRVPVGRDQMPELAVLPRPTGGLLRLVAGARSAVAGLDGAEAGGRGGGASTDAEAVPVSLGALAPPAWRSALRMLAGLLLAGGSGVQARMPYEIDLR